MRLIEGFRGLAPGDRGASAAIGNFDGVHRGHQALIDGARAGGGPVGVITFEPHPRSLFDPDAPPFCLTTPDEKARLLAGYGVERLYRLTFDRAMAGMAAEAFVETVLVDGLGIRNLVLGADFRFGKGRRGGSELLHSLGDTLGFGVTVQALVGDEAGEFASTALRQLVADGDCEAAARQLGRWHTVSGPVIRGDQRGRTLGYPTANLAFGAQIVPCFGIYATWVDVHSGPHAGRYPGVASIGERPTFGENAANFEVHLFDFSGDLYGTPISAGLVRRLRGEIRFDGVDALVRQMDRDSAEARAVLETASIPQ